VLDLATRKIVGWAMRDHMRTELPLAALMMAAQRQRPASGLIHHSDRGSQGGLNRSLQRFENGGVAWTARSGVRISAHGHACGRPVDHR
jgi:transposase InsO family protein